MEAIGIADLALRAEAWDEAVMCEPGIDPFCSQLAWQLSYHEAFEPERTLRLAVDGAAMVLLAESHMPDGRSYLEPLENMWGFAASLAGDGAYELLGRILREAPKPTLLLGLPESPEPLRPLAALLQGLYGARRLESTTRFVASLEGGLEGWLARRSSTFRRNLRAASRRVEAVGIVIEEAPLPNEAALHGAYARVLAIEGRSWKSLSGNGADREPMRGFYARLWPRLFAHGALRLLLARREGEDVGYLHGALCGERFRGLQFSFDARFDELGLGNVLQYEMLRRLCDEGLRAYDLGARSDYKRRWAEPALTTRGLFLRPTR